MLAWRLFFCLRDSDAARNLHRVGNHWLGGVVRGGNPRMPQAAWFWRRPNRRTILPPVGYCAVGYLGLLNAVFAEGY